jgi:predicted  nucleic acid-binding Zn-ribbon protein
MSEAPTTCVDCGRVYADDESPPCPDCGCRTVSKHLTGQVTAHGTLSGEHRRPGVRYEITSFMERTKLSALGRLARESLRYDRSHPSKTVKTHRVEEQQPGGSWTIEHDEREEYPARRKRRR